MRIVFVIMLLMSFSFPARSQENRDVLSILLNIEKNKSLYIGKPFSTLLDSLAIPIKFFSPAAHIHHKKDEETSTSFSFFFPETADEIYLTYPHLNIYWEPDLDAKVSHELYRVHDGGCWVPAVEAFYRNAIVEDIGITEL